jgi:hypothetical protein
VTGGIATHPGLPSGGLEVEWCLEWSCTGLAMKSALDNDDCDATGVPRHPLDGLDSAGHEVADVLSDVHGFWHVLLKGDLDSSGERPMQAKLAR